MRSRIDFYLDSHSIQHGCSRRQCLYGAMPSSVGVRVDVIGIRSLFDDLLGDNVLMDLCHPV